MLLSYQHPQFPTPLPFSGEIQTLNQEEKWTKVHNGRRHISSPSVLKWWAAQRASQRAHVQKKERFPEKEKNPSRAQQPWWTSALPSGNNSKRSHLFRPLLELYQISQIVMCPTTSNGSSLPPWASPSPPFSSWYESIPNFSSSRAMDGKIVSYFNLLDSPLFCLLI